MDLVNDIEVLYAIAKQLKDCLEKAGPKELTSFTISRYDLEGEVSTADFKKGYQMIKEMAGFETYGSTPAELGANSPVRELIVDMSEIESISPEYVVVVRDVKRLTSVIDKIEDACVKVKKDNEPKMKLRFDAERSLLYVMGKRVRINMRSRETNAHKILKYLFSQKNISDEAYYSEIIEEAFGESHKTTKWTRCFTACRDIQNKVRGQTVDKIDDFLIFDTGVTGKVKINPKYINLG